MRDASQVHCQVPAELEEAAVLKLTLQPLVENCIQHGMAGEKEKLTVVISAAVKGDRLCLTVEDDGLGINNVRAAGPAAERRSGRRGEWYRLP